jgi:hypothetical protein
MIDWLDASLAPAWLAWIALACGGLLVAIAAGSRLAQRRARRRLLDETLDRWLDGEPSDEDARRQWGEDP